MLNCILFCSVVLLNISLTRIYLWVDFLKDMVDFWIQVVPPEKDKNPEVALEKLLPEQKGKIPRLEFVLNYNQDCDIVVIESAYVANPTTLVVKFMVSRNIFVFLYFTFFYLYFITSVFCISYILFHNNIISVFHFIYCIYVGFDSF